ncbi:hypothetical protein ACS0TY_018030 [Phlomoides rotata]
MEVDIHCKFQRISNGYGELGDGEKMDDQHQDDEDEGENKRSAANDGVDLGGGVGRLYGWPSSRIVRVSRASGGKDRHSKVLTSKGLRDRRVRLSVNTAIQFYDLQDRLGYDQPSKAVEWLLTAAASAIEELPPMNTTFLDTSRLRNERNSGAGGGYRLAFDSAEVDINGGGVPVTKSSPGSSNSETSKGSGFSISRSESRMKARERAKERVVGKEKENDSSYVTSFTELLSGRNNCISGGGPDYFTSGLFGPPAKQPAPPFSVTADHHHHHHPELQPFSFASDGLVSPGFSAVNRGTLQSNSPSPPSLLPIFPPPPSFFSGAAAPAHNQHHYLTGFDARLQLHYGRNSSQKEKEKY